MSEIDRDEVLGALEALLAELPRSEHLPVAAMVLAPPAAALAGIDLADAEDAAAA
jgi:hypothetical protein